MKSLLKTLVPMSFLVLGACAPKASSEKTTAHIDQVVAGVEADAKKAIDGAFPGGQPGSVSLSGAFSFGGVFDPRVSLSSSSGVGRNGQRTARSSSAVALNDNMETSPGFAALAKDSTYINIGCGDVAPAGMTKIDADFSQTVSMLRAHTIYICGSQRFASSMVFIDAANIILRNVKVARVGSVESMLTVDAEVLTLDGQNQIATQGTNAYISGPSLSLSSAHIEGTGSLAISARGFDDRAK